MFDIIPTSSETQALSPQPLEREQVEVFLQNHLGGDIHEVSPIGKGDWSQAFSFLHEDTALVARFGAYIEDFRKDQHAARFAVPALPVPRVREIGQVLGRYFCVSERAYGNLLDGRDADQMQALVPAVFQMLDALRDADLGATAGFGGWDADGVGSLRSWREFLLAVDEETPRVHGWHTRMTASATGAAPYTEALAYLRSHLDCCPEVRHLLHTDLLHFNVLVEGDQIRGVVDWGNALYGDFLYELAAFTFYAPWYPAMAGIDWRAEAQRHYARGGVDVTHFAERLRCYEAHIGLSGMAYSAFTGNEADLADTANRTLSLLRGEA